MRECLGEMGSLIRGRENREPPRAQVAGWPASKPSREKWAHPTTAASGWVAPGSRFWAYLEASGIRSPAAR